MCLQELINKVTAVPKTLALKLLTFDLNRVHEVSIKELYGAFLFVQLHPEQIQSRVHHLQFRPVVLKLNQEFLTDDLVQLLLHFFFQSHIHCLLLDLYLVLFDQIFHLLLMLLLDKFVFELMFVITRLICRFAFFKISGVNG